jgi:hypothetical protein
MTDTIEFERNENILQLHYNYALNPKWILSALEFDDKVVIYKIFHFNRKNVDPNSLNKLIEFKENETIGYYQDFLTFNIGTLSGDYFKIHGSILNIHQDVYIHKTFELKAKHFRSTRKISIFKKISQLVKEDIYIGGSHKNNISKECLSKIIKSIPTDLEIDKYDSARISNVLRNYLENTIDGLENYNKYLNKRISTIQYPIKKHLIDYEKQKFTLIYRHLYKMLEDEIGYSEKNWQENIKDIITIIFPQYIAAYREVPILDTDSNTKRSADFLLIDASGHIDLLEIKKPSDYQILQQTQYRGNYIPTREMSGCIMQTEKYIYNISKSGKKGEDLIHKKFSNVLDNNIQIKVTNPRGIILIGRDKNFTKKQNLDFEVIRRKYKNIADIITYDDLLRRLKMTISQMTHNK